MRFLLSMLIFFGYCFNYMQKVDMGIAIVCMVNNTALKEMSYNYHFKNDTPFTPSNFTYDIECQKIDSKTAKKFVSTLTYRFIYNFIQSIFQANFF